MEVHEQSRSRLALMHGKSDLIPNARWDTFGSYVINVDSEQGTGK